MNIKTIYCRLGNMRKNQDWVVYPVASGLATHLTIQCDNRIARVELSTGKTMLSDGKGGHQGFIKLSPALGATEVICRAETLAELRQIAGVITDAPVSICG